MCMYTIPVREAPCMYSVYMLGLSGAIELATARIMKSFGA